MSEDVLKKPVHYILVKDTLLDRLRREGKLQGEHQAALLSPPRPKLPTEDKQHSSLISKVMVQSSAKSGNIAKQSVLRTKLRVIHNNIPPIPPEKAPPCDTCKTAACCRAFVVGIEKAEYESGLYGEYAIEVTDEMKKQLQADSYLFPIAMNAPSLFDQRGDENHFLEGVVGTACPFLGTDMRCTIYEYRPITCRTYTCVGDERITQDMRDGKVNIAEAMQGVGPRTVKGK